jgi:hypothetical protein
MRTVLICHHDAPLDLLGLKRWMASFSDLVGVIVVQEAGGNLVRRVRSERKRSGLLGLADVLAFRAYYKAFLARSDMRWETEQCSLLSQRYPEADAPIFVTRTPNTPETAEFLKSLSPDLVLARCKHLIRREVFSIPRAGVLVLHPGICPEYRNAHGCFWALVRRDLSRVGASLLRIDDGIDTGPIYGYYTYAFDEIRETHFRIQWRCVLENLDSLAAKFREIADGTAPVIDTRGRTSQAWGQPWLSRWIYWKLLARTSRK